MVRTTKAQRRALFRVFQRMHPTFVSPFKREDAMGRKYRVTSERWREFRASVQPEFGGKAILVQWAGMWLGIEEDGYTHS